jgi:hypothetical protein
MNMLHLQLGATITRRLAEIDAEVGQLHADGYGVDADRLLDERIDLVPAREDLPAMRCRAGAAPTRSGPGNDRLPDDRDDGCTRRTGEAW